MSETAETGTATVAQAVKGILETILGQPLSELVEDPESAILGAIKVDSLDFTDLVQKLETELDIIFEDDEFDHLDPDNVGTPFGEITVRQLIIFFEKKVKAKNGE